MDENQHILHHAKMGHISSSKIRTGRKKNQLRKPLQIEADKIQELENAKTLELEHVLGLTVFSNSALTSDPMTGLVAYPAGCVLVLLDCVKYKQLGTLHTPRRSITAAKFSPDSRYVLTGESGLHPAVRVWELSSMTEVATLRGHNVGIISVSFSPRMREIIVVGDAQDMMISVWAWPSKIMKTLNKFADEIYAMDVAEDSSFFTTVGNRHVKFYYLDNMRTLPSHINSTCPVPLPTRCGILDNLKENCFCDVVCGRGSSSLYIFVVAMSGILCQINRDRYLERWVNVNMVNACCLTADENCIFVGGSQGVVRIFRALDLQIITTLPRPHILGLDISQVTAPYVEDISDDMSMSALEQDTKDKESSNQYPTTRAITYDSCHEILTVVYGDRSIYIWSRCKQDLSGSDVYYFSKKHSSMYHRGCVWGLTTYPAVLDSDPEEAALGGALPPGALISVSADGTLRAWDVCANICEESMLKRNSVSAECLKIVYADKLDTTKKLRQQRKPREGPFVRHGKQSFSAVTVCPDGLHIATGNKHGRVCIYDTNTMNVMTTMLAHEAEVTALGYSITKRYKVLASGSRDRMIHVMDASHGYQLLTTLDDHSSTITAINFTYIARCILMVTSSLDMSVLIRAYLDSSVFSFKPVRAIVEKRSVVDFAINQWSGLIAMACQDRLVRVYSIISSVESTTFRGCPSHGGQLVKIEIDPSGQYLLTACSNRTINLLQFNTGFILNTFYGHAESITCIKFSHNMKHIITSAIDGCIFLWRLPEPVTYSVKREMAEMGKLTRGMVLGERWKKSRLVTGVLPLDVRSEPEFNTMTESASDLKIDLSLYNLQDQNYQARAEENRYLATVPVECVHDSGPLFHIGTLLCVISLVGLAVLVVCNDQFSGKISLPLEADAVESSDCIVLKKMADINSKIWASMPAEMSSMGIGRPIEDETNNKQDNEMQTNPTFHPYLNNQISSNTISPTSEAWLSTCYERRRIFKLEARSIKKILAMMQLVTDAMEKDLAGSNWLMYSSTGLGTSNHLSSTYYSPDVPSRRISMMEPASLRPLQQQLLQQQPEPSSSIFQPLPPVMEVPLPADEEYSQQQQLTQWKPEQKSGDFVCSFSQQNEQPGQSSFLTFQTLPSSISAWHDQKQSQNVHGICTSACTNSEGHSVYADIKQLFSGQRLSTDCLKQQIRAQHNSRIPVRSGSRLIKSISRSSKALAVTTSVQNNISEGCSDTFGYVNNLENYNYNTVTQGSQEEFECSPELHSSCSNSFLLDSSIHCCNESDMEPFSEVLINDKTKGHDRKELQYFTSDSDKSLDANVSSGLLSNLGVFKVVEGREENNNVSDSCCCAVKADINGNMGFVANKSDYALLCDNLMKTDVHVSDTGDKPEESQTKATDELTNSFENIFKNVEMFEAISDDLPSVEDSVDDDADIVLDEISKSKNDETTEMGTCLNCIVHERSSAEFHEFSRAHCCSSVEVLCGEAGVLLENKERCVGRGDGDNVRESQNKDGHKYSGHNNVNFYPKSLAYKADNLVPDILDNTAKSTSFFIND